MKMICKQILRPNFTLVWLHPAEVAPPGGRESVDSYGLCFVTLGRSDGLGRSAVHVDQGSMQESSLRTGDERYQIRNILGFANPRDFFIPHEVLLGVLPGDILLRDEGCQPRLEARCPDGPPG